MSNEYCSMLFFESLVEEQRHRIVKDRLRDFETSPRHEVSLDQQPALCRHFQQDGAS